eukprot:TRINITY_DN7290_c0_g1_i13.p5 TRINITY_DN7290_c0_g1~~TRINITY_DN7290_c0_g1_i13.p5  ORF type:complete len:133 (-),score=16.62 TRINITY_DN7290_c0_g1_i13:606-1004(-)
MSNTTNEILEKLKTLTLLEAAELVSQIEETFGVDASASTGGAMVMATAGPSSLESQDVEPTQEEKTTFDVIVEDVPGDQNCPNQNPPSTTAQVAQYQLSFLLTDNIVEHELILSTKCVQGFTTSQFESLQGR